MTFAFHEKDLNLANNIKDCLGFGKIDKVKGKKAYTLVINKSDVRNFLLIVNGFLRTDAKLAQISSYKSIPFELAPLDKSDLTENYWFSGFFDGDGYFKLVARTGRITKRIQKGGFKQKIRGNECQVIIKLDQKSSQILHIKKEGFGGGCTEPGSGPRMTRSCSYINDRYHSKYDK